MNNQDVRSWVCRNMANGITSIGILLCFISQYVIFAHPEYTLTLLKLAVCAVATDFLDGEVARYFERKGYVGSVSCLGKFLDRFRDKIFQFTFLFFLIWYPRVDYHLKWAFCLLIVSEVALLITLFVGATRKTDVSANNWGRRKMFFGCALILACLAKLVAQEHGLTVPYFVTCFLWVVAAATIFLTAMSLNGHIATCRKKISAG